MADGSGSWKPHGNRLAACEGKQGFVSAALAWRVTTRRQRREAGRTGRNRVRKPGQVYHCRFCGRWHIGGVE